MKYRFVLTMVLFIAGVLLGTGLTGPEVYAAPEIEAPQAVMLKQLPVLAGKPDLKGGKYCQELYERYIYEPLILRPRLEETILEYNANVTKIERLTPEERVQVIDAIIASSKVYDLDPLLVASVIAAESSFRIRDRRGRILQSRCKAIGLMQIMPIHGWKNDLTTIAGNVDVGCWYLRLSIDRTATTEIAIAAYNAGPKRPEWAMKHHPETSRYVPRVMGIYEGLKGITS